MQFQSVNAHYNSEGKHETISDLEYFAPEM